MAKLLKLTISKVDAPVFDGEVLSVTLPGSEGEMTIMADHESLISVLKTGTMTIKMENGEEVQHPVQSGTLEISNNHATVLI